MAPSNFRLLLAPQGRKRKTVLIRSGRKGRAGDGHWAFVFLLCCILLGRLCHQCNNTGIPFYRPVPVSERVEEKPWQPGLTAACFLLHLFTFYRHSLHISFAWFTMFLFSVQQGWPNVLTGVTTMGSTVWQSNWTIEGVSVLVIHFTW